MAGDGLAIARGPHTTRLKWHRLRRSFADPEFSIAVMEDGFRLGASMELDLQVRADGGFVVMHDATLDRETTGHGPVGDRTGPELASLSYRQQPRTLLLGEELATLLGAAHPDALLQFDMKNDLGEVGRLGIDCLAAQFGDKTRNLIVSGGSTELIMAIGDRLPGIQRGIDPTDRLVEIGRDGDLAAMESALREELVGPAEPHLIFLAWELILEARQGGLDLIALCHDEGKTVDAWTYTLADPARGFSDAEWAQFSALMALSPDQITTDEPIATEAAWLARTSDNAHV